jgi:quinol monooxygenase YgiN
MQNSNPSNQPYTFGIWTVKPGKESEFTKLWSAFAESTVVSNGEIGKAHLLQDIDNPSKFITFGAWDSLDTVLKWRESPGFKSFAENARKLCDEFQPRNLKEIYATK